MRLNKRTFAILAILITVGSVIYFVGSSRYNIYPLVGSLEAFASPTKNKMKAVTTEAVIAKGRSLIRDDQPGDNDRYRVTALILATDELIRKLKVPKASDNSADFDFSGTWKGLTLESRQVSEGRLVHQSVVDLTLQSAAQGRISHRWKVVNQRLEIPASTQPLNLELLKSALKERGIEVSKGRRIGNSLWEQKLVLKP